MDGQRRGGQSEAPGRVPSTTKIAVSGGLLTVDEACQRYSLSLEEFTSWQRAVERSGMPGLRVTRLKHYRDVYERQQRY